MKNRSKHLPAGAWHVPAAFLALMLTACLWATQLGVFGLQAMTSVRLHERVALDKPAVESQMDRIARNMAWFVVRRRIFARSFLPLKCRVSV